MRTAGSGSGSDYRDRQQAWLLGLWFAPEQTTHFRHGASPRQFASAGRLMNATPAWQTCTSKSQQHDVRLGRQYTLYLSTHNDSGPILFLSTVNSVNWHKPAVGKLSH
jgi:hypothetical protein